MSRQQYFILFIYFIGLLNVRNYLQFLYIINDTVIYRMHIEVLSGINKMRTVVSMFSFPHFEKK